MGGLYAVFLVVVISLSTYIVFDKSYCDSVIERLGLTGSGLFGSAELYHWIMVGAPGQASSYMLAALATTIVGFFVAPLCKRVFG